jgi:very-short-patch-repair endonuclease
MTGLEATFLFWWNLLARTPEPEQEYRFHAIRRWRFDFAWPDALVAVECEGGTWTRGRHTRGKGFENDCYKYNAATAQGWRVFRCTKGMLDDNPQAFITMVYEAVKNE